MVDELNVGPEKILWLLICDLGYANILVPFYATSEEEAEQEAQVWIGKQGPRILRRISLQPYPCGFKIHHRELPGKLVQEI